MSARHRQKAQEGRGKLSKDDRRVDVRRDRHTAKVLMDKDPESLGTGRTVRVHEHPSRPKEPSVPAPAVEPVSITQVKEDLSHDSPAPLGGVSDIVLEVPKVKGMKHWKEPFWKRRKAERHRKNEALARLVHEGPPPIVLEEDVDDTQLRYPAAT